MPCVCIFTQALLVTCLLLFGDSYQTILLNIHLSQSWLSVPIVFSFYVKPNMQHNYPCQKFYNLKSKLGLSHVLQFDRLLVTKQSVWKRLLCYEQEFGQPTEPPLQIWTNMVVPGKFLLRSLQYEFGQPTEPPLQIWTLNKHGCSRKVSPQKLAIFHLLFLSFWNSRD